MIGILTGPSSTSSTCPSRRVLAMPCVRSAGATIHYLTLPDVPRCPAGRPCITFVHGGGGNAYIFLRQMPFFAAEGYYVISVSVRGWGSSRLDGDDPEHFASERLAGDIVEVLNAVGVDRTALVGHSIGGFYVARMAMEAPERLTHAVFSSTFYGLVDEPATLSPPSEPRLPWVTRFLNEPIGASATRDDLALELRGELPPEDVARGEAAEREGRVRTRYPTQADSFTPEFRASHPDLCWLFDASNDGNTQVVSLNLKARFRLLHDSAATPRALRAAYAGPLLFTTSECDALVHWEMVSLVSSQMRTFDPAGSGTTNLHWFDGPLCHAPYLEDAPQYNRVILDFIRDFRPAFSPTPAFAAPLATRKYALLVSGTFNPPHRGHVRLGLHAAAALEAEGHEVVSITYVPVHDNYMFNKVTAAGSVSEILFSMEQRCELLRGLVEAEGEKAERCHVVNYEGDHGGALLDTSPNYWERKLPDGYLKTVPTMALIEHFAEGVRASEEGTRVGVVFGVDNLAAMATWNSPAKLLASADLVLVSRESASVSFPRDPAPLLSSVWRIETRAPVPVSYEGTVLFGESNGSVVNSTAIRDGVVYLIPALEGDDEGLSSTAVRNALQVLVAHNVYWERAVCLAAGELSFVVDEVGGEEDGEEEVKPVAEEVKPVAVAPEVFSNLALIEKHGYDAAQLAPLLSAATRGAEVLEQMHDKATQRGELVEVLA